MPANYTNMDELEAQLAAVLTLALGVWVASLAALAAIPFLLVGHNGKEA